MKIERRESTIIATTKYCDTIISASAVCGDNDDFNEELGKAIARIRLEKKIRQMEIEKTINTKEGLMKMNWTYMKKNLVCRLIQKVDEELAIQRQYYTTQKKLEQLLTRNDSVRWAGKTEKQIVREAFDEIMGR